jgi:hypothetical protein
VGRKHTKEAKAYSTVSLRPDSSYDLVTVNYFCATVSSAFQRKFRSARRSLIRRGKARRYE